MTQLRSRKRAQPAPVSPSPAPSPRRLGLLLIVFSAVLCLGLFSPETRDSDFWWHLRTGQYIVETRSLPVPDPFAYTTAAAPLAYAGEAVVRHFNLTHEWLAQVLLYGAYRVGGFPGVVLFRALLLAAFCGLAGFVAWRRSGVPDRSSMAALAAAAIAFPFALDRPQLFTYVFLALTVVVLESRRRLWLLPPLFLIWANCHGGFFLGWVVLAAYCIEALVACLRGKSFPAERALWLWSAVAVLASGINPNGFRAVQVLLLYRSSAMQSHLLEWGRPPLWPPPLFAVLLAAAASAMVWQRRKVRIGDWLLLAAFSVAAFTADRNTIFIGFFAPVFLACYLPWKRALPAVAGWVASAALAAGIIWGIAVGDFFQLRAADWRYPSGAADFLDAHHVTGRMFNTYEYGGYLIWRLWPRQHVFIDGRALSENVFDDYARILYNHDASGGKSARQLLEQYGIQVIVMNTFEYVTGTVYLLAPALADPVQTEWKLVYRDAQALVWMRRPPAGVAPLDSLEVFGQMEAECGLHLDREPDRSRCARSLAQTFAKIGDFTRARRWLGVYLDHPHPPDPEAEQAYRQYVSAGK
ncbi:MAG: hypothetical protein ACLQPN_01205 [Bryobacteraceae bacterium]